jgi:transcriptional regulator with XRE-family HTH domain
MVSSEDSAWDVPPSIFGTRAGGPTVQRLVLGSQLHRLRDSRGITAEQAAEAIRGSHSKISRMEHGRVGFKERDVGDLLTLYGVTDSEERAALLNLAREANTPGWWHAYSDILPTWLEPFVGLEAAASFIRTYQIQSVPGLLQTEGYARALIGRGSAATEEEIARRGELRTSRQEILRSGVPSVAVKSSASSSGTSSKWPITPPSPCRSCRSARVRTPPWAGPSRSCASPSPTCMTSCTSSS